jgi:uncharacterized protein
MPTLGLRFSREWCERRAVISFLAAADIPDIPDQYAKIAYIALLAAVFAGSLYFFRALSHISDEGGRVRMDLFSFADMPVLGVLLTFFGLSAASYWLAGEQPAAAAPALKVEQILPGALSMAVFPIGVVIFFVARNVSIIEVFGLRKVSLPKSLACAIGFLAALLPALFLVSIFTTRMLGNDAQLQPLVNLYQEGVRQRDWNVIWTTVLAAGIIAPIGEEVLFRGYIYPAMKRVLGAIPSALITSLLFAAIHNNAAGLPTLTILAVALTVAYERTGSLLVPMAMHALFNCTNLLTAALMAGPKP